MARTPKDITPAELDVLQVLWDQGPATIRQIRDILYPKGKASEYATVQKLLERLEDKECVQRDASTNVHVFSASISRDELIGRRLQSVAEQLCGGSWTPLLTNLVKQERLSPEERKQLRDLIDELDRDARSRPPRR